MAHETPMPVVVGKRVGPDSHDDEDDRASQARRLVKRTVTTIEEFQLDPPPPHVLLEAAPAPETAPAAPEHAPEPAPPDLSKRSKIEMEMTAHLMFALFGTVDLHQFWAALRLGDEMGLIDSVIELPNGLHVLFEWDGGLYHTDDPNRVKGDIRKTVRMLERPLNALVVRVRADGADDITEEIHAAIDESDSLDESDKERVVLVSLEEGRQSKNHERALQAIAKALHPLLVDRGGEEVAPFARRLKHYTTYRPKIVAAIHIVQETLVKCVEAYAENVAKLKEALEGSEDAAQRVLNARGVITRLPDVLTGIEALVETCGVPRSELKRIVKGCLAARIGDATYAPAMRSFCDRFNLLTKQLVTLLDNGGFAKRVADSDFVGQILHFMGELGIVESKVATLLCGVASRVHDEAFLRNAKAFQTYFEIEGDGMAGLLGRTSFAKRLDKATFLVEVVAFMEDEDLRFEKGDVTTLLTDGASSRIGQDAFLSGVKELKGTFGFKKSHMVTLVGSLASRMVADPEKETSLVQCVEIVKTGLDFDTGQLVTVLSGVASHLDDPDKLVDNMKRFRDDVGLSKDQLVTAMHSQSVVPNLGDAKWMEAAKACKAVVPDFDTFASLLSQGSVASQLLAEGFAEKLAWVLSLTENVARFHDSFWATKMDLSKPVVELLVNEYGFRADDLPSRNLFWSKIKSKKDVTDMEADLATLKTTGAVNSRIKKLNGKGCAGRGATKCMHVRPKPVHERFEPPKALKQPTIMSMFKRG